MAILFTLMLLIGSITGTVSFTPVDTNTSDAESLYEAVLSYDFTKGRSRTLEDSIRNLVEKSSLTEDYNVTAHNFALKAKIIYYYNIYKNHTALEALKELEEYQLTEEDPIFLADFYAHVYQALGNTKLADEYQQEYDNLTKKCGE